MYGGLLNKVPPPISTSFSDAGKHNGGTVVSLDSRYDPVQARLISQAYAYPDSNGLTQVENSNFEC